MSAQGLTERIRRLIETDGPLPFDRYMEIALYDTEHGFFGSGPLRSQAEGDFLTSPEISPEFGTTLARWVEAEYLRLGEPADFTVVEAGASSGALLSPLLKALPFDPKAVAIEVAAAARNALRQKLPKVVTLSSFQGLKPFRGVVIANELLDNLPMALAVRVEDGNWRERRVGWDENRLVMVDTPARLEVLHWLEAYAGEVPTGGVVECQSAAREWMEEVIGLLRGGALVVIDYGDTSAGLLHRRSRGGTLRTYRSHHLSEDPLHHPGATDITADVDFSALVDLVSARGMRYELVRQGDFLRDLGLADRRARLREQELAEARDGDPFRRLGIRSRVKEIDTLLHPRGFGDFLVLSAYI
ncbi:MAG: hypothetical protein F4X21_03000 [Acidimicrobiia bacterium]|nr:hypothetical protein [Acidimicrobiia bacterium]